MRSITVPVEVDTDDVLDEMDVADIDKYLVRRRSRENSIAGSSPEENAQLLERAYQELRLMQVDLPRSLRDYFWNTLGRHL